MNKNRNVKLKKWSMKMSNVTIGGNLIVNGASELRGPNFLSRFTRIGDVSVAGDFSVLENFTVTESVTVAGDGFFNSVVCDTAALGPSWIVGSVNVGIIGASFLNMQARSLKSGGSCSVAGNAEITGVLSAVGSTFLGSLNATNLTATDIVLLGSIAITDNLASSGQCTTPSALSVGGDITAGKCSVIGKVTSVGSGQILTTTCDHINILNSMLVAGNVIAEGRVTATTGLTFLRYLETQSKAATAITDSKFFSRTGQLLRNASVRLVEDSNDFTGGFRLNGPNGLEIGSLGSNISYVEITLASPYSVLNPQWFIAPHGKYSWTPWNIMATKSSVRFFLSSGTHITIPVDQPVGNGVTIDYLSFGNA